MLVSLFCFHTNFRNDESESFVPDYEEVVTEVYTEVSVLLKWTVIDKDSITEFVLFWNTELCASVQSIIQMLEITESATEAPPVVEPYINSKYDPNRVWLNQGSESEWTPDESDAEQLEYDVKLDLSYE